LKASVEEEGQSTPVSTSSQEAKIIAEVGSRLLRALGEAAPKFDYEFRRGRFSPSAAPSCLQVRAKIRFSINLIDELDDEQSLSFVLGHEIGHVIQYAAAREFQTQVCQGRAFNVRSYELMADTISGWLYGRLYSSGGNNSVLEAISQMADYEFTDTAHHGTVTERVSAFNLGTSAAAKNKPLSVTHIMRNIDLFHGAIFPSNVMDSFRSSREKEDKYIERLFVD